MPTLPRRVLIVRLGALGDVANTLTFPGAWKRHDPDVHIGWVVHEGAQPLIEGHPWVDRVHVWPRKSSMSSILPELRAQTYDVACDLQRILKSALLARRSGAARVVGFDRGRTKELSWLLAKERLSGEPSGAHRVHGYQDFARHFGLSEPDVKPILREDSQGAAWAEARQEELGGAPILLNLGATKSANRWAPKSFGELARRLREAFDVPVAFIGSRADEPLALRASAIPKKRHGVQNLVGRTDLPQLWELLRRARVVVSADSGPMHLAAAVDTPVVALFGASDADQTGPWGAEHVVLREDPACSPCVRRTCNQPRHACMEDLGVERVFDSIAERLATSEPTAST